MADNATTVTEESPESQASPTIESTTQGQDALQISNCTPMSSDNLRDPNTSAGHFAVPKLPISANPSTSSLQRVLSTPRQAAASLDGVLGGSRGDVPAKTAFNSPSWPTPPRLKSPPPGSRNGLRREHQEYTQSNTAKRLAPVSAPDLAAAMLIPDVDNALPQPSPHQRVPPRGLPPQNTGLETVVEGSVPTTPSIDPVFDPMDRSRYGFNGDANSTTSLPEPKMENTLSKPATNRTDNESKLRTPSTSRATSTQSSLAKRSFTSLTGGKKAALEPLRTMTVETEPVNTTTTGLGDRRTDSGSVRTKTSTETIRPRKEKKKPSRKPGSLHPGGVTSAADIFEAKVASAVDEVDTDDSDETFVYESNPPEPQSYRHHSRTPSATSMASTNDQNRSNKHGIRSGSNALAGRKSVKKFSSSAHNREQDENGNGSRNMSSAPRHHPIGRHERNNHLSLFDADSPFAQSRQPVSPRTATGSIKTSRANSPRLTNGHTTSPKKYGGNAYDNYEDAADDERAPLIGNNTVRISRNRHSRRPHSRDFRSLEMGEAVDHGCWTRHAGWLVLLVLLIFVCTGIGAFTVAVNKSLLEVEIKRIVNVLASEQELMLDLDVRAVNPNLFAVTVTDLDINIFVQSPYVGTSDGWQRLHPDVPGPGLPIGVSKTPKVNSRGWFWPDPPSHSRDGVDEGTDPDDPEGPQKMLLGRVYFFDSPLTFEPSPLRRIPSSSVGEIRLAKPGNKTEIGGSGRWERALLHDFDLIVRGVIQYQLPLSSKTRSAKISGRKTVHPDGEDNGTDPEQKRNSSHPSKRT